MEGGAEGKNRGEKIVVCEREQSSRGRKMRVLD